jgi:hypothetical protein
MHYTFKDLQDIRNGLLQETICMMTCRGRAKSKMSINIPWSENETLPLQITCSIYKHSAQEFSQSISKILQTSSMNINILCVFRIDFDKELFYGHYSQVP